MAVPVYDCGAIFETEKILLICSVLELSSFPELSSVLELSSFPELSSVLELSSVPGFSYFSSETIMVIVLLSASL